MFSELTKKWRTELYGVHYFTIFNIHSAKNCRLDEVNEKRKTLRYSEHRSSLNAPGLHILTDSPRLVRTSYKKVSYFSKTTIYILAIFTNELRNWTLQGKNIQKRVLVCSAFPQGIEELFSSEI